MAQDLLPHQDSRANDNRTHGRLIDYQKLRGRSTLSKAMENKLIGRLCQSHLP